MSSIVKKLSICDKIPEKTKQAISLLYAFDDSEGDNILFITTDDCVYGMGANTLGALGLGHNRLVLSPQLIPELSHQEIQHFVNGFDFVLAINAERQVYSWGHNSSGQLGRETPQFAYYFKPKRLSRFDYRDVIQVSCGYFHALALTTDGEVYGWGANAWGQVGCGSSKLRNIPAPMRLCFPSKHVISAVYCGKYTSFAVTSEGLVFSWGQNQYSQLGHDNDGQCVYAPKYVMGVQNVKTICPSNTVSHLLTTDGLLYFCGQYCMNDINSCSGKTPKLSVRELKSGIQDMRQVVSYKRNVYHNFHDFYVSECQLTENPIDLSDESDERLLNQLSNSGQTPREHLYESVDYPAIKAKKLEARDQEINAQTATNLMKTTLKTSHFNPFSVTSKSTPLSESLQMTTSKVIDMNKDSSLTNVTDPDETFDAKSIDLIDLLEYPERSRQELLEYHNKLQENIENKFIEPEFVTIVDNEDSGYINETDCQVMADDCQLNQSSEYEPLITDFV
ncbi:unnamed protein product [Oppiella nova]|uniref:RCC1-like domain-containing protein n=1 Tax=Oppiella nova TaxID=334625 RepID=A0A7R9M3T6_9ACAR|nr:unnamed protein product [Oppiella nova]CAG2170152.1 unnamed protein product [Oppiella nova]